MKSSPAAVQIRRMTPEDLDRVMEIAQSLDHAPQWPHQAYVAALDSLNTPHRIALVAAGPYPDPNADPNSTPETGAVVGFLVASSLPPQAELETIAVSVEAQRRGVAGRLFAAMGEALKQERVREVILEVRPSNRAALAFYRAQGFAETGRRPRYYADPVEDAVLLALRLV
jgi:[ribosomal protein S18]-alanine N-acetyltransferase